MASSSHRQETSPQRFCSYLNSIQKEFEFYSNATNPKDSNPRPFNTYLGGLKVEFKLLYLEIKSLSKEVWSLCLLPCCWIVDITVKMKKLKDVRRKFACERCSMETTSAPQVRNYEDCPFFATTIYTSQRLVHGMEQSWYIPSLRSVHLLPDLGNKHEVCPECIQRTYTSYLHSWLLAKWQTAHFCLGISFWLTDTSIVLVILLRFLPLMGDVAASHRDGMVGIWDVYVYMPVDEKVESACGFG